MLANVRLHADEQRRGAYGAPPSRAGEARVEQTAESRAASLAI